MINIIEQIECQRIKQGIKKRELCAYAEITPRFYSMVVAGKSDISLKITLKLIEKLGFSLFLGIKE